MRLSSLVLTVIINKRTASLKKQKQTAALPHFRWDTAVCYCSFMEASNRRKVCGGQYIYVVKANLCIYLPVICREHISYAFEIRSTIYRVIHALHALFQFRPGQKMALRAFYYINVQILLPYSYIKCCQRHLFNASN